MTGQLDVALMTGKPLAAAFKLDRDDVVRPAIMSAPGFFIDIDANDIHAVDFHNKINVGEALAGRARLCRADKTLRA